MIEVALVVAGALVGGGVAWMLAHGRHQATLRAEREPLAARLASAETLADELRKQLSHRELETAELRGALEAERAGRAAAAAREAAARESAEAQRRLLDEARERLADTFKALSADALRASSAAFLEAARETVDGQLGRSALAIDATVRPVAEALERFEAHARALEAARQHAYGSLEEQLRALAASSAALQRETGSLVAALRAPHVRGRWGEITLQRVVELAGLTEHCDYVEQLTVEGAGGRLRPDMIVRLPGEREIVVDAKVPLTAFLDAAGAATPEERAAAFGRHAQQVRQHMTALSAKQYWEQFPRAPELVVMFIPGEAFVAAAVHHDAGLLEDGMARGVVVATPSTLMALLRAIAHGWRQQRIAVNAQEISELGRALYDRLRTLGEHFDDLGTALTRAVAAHNRAVGSMESRVLPAARRFRDLGAATGGDIAPLGPVDQLPRPLTAPEFPQQLSTSDPPA